MGLFAATSILITSIICGTIIAWKYLDEERYRR